MNILLIASPYKLENNKFKGNNREFLGIGYIGSVLRNNGENVTIIDPGVHKMDISELIDLVKRGNFDLIGFTLTERSAKVAIYIIKEFRAHGINSTIIVGGHYSSLSYEAFFEACPEVDAIVMGEGEITIVDFVKNLKDKRKWKDVKGISYLENNTIVVTEKRPLIEDLDTIPFASRDLLPLNIENRGQRAYMISSRGCYGSCSYCSMNMFYAKHPNAKKWRARSAENVVDEMEMLVKKLKVGVIAFDDDNFMGPGSAGKERAKKVADEILKRNLKVSYIFPCRPNDVDYDLFSYLKKSGLNGVFLGIDSMNQRSLDLFNRKLTVKQNLDAIKILDDLGLRQQYGFINFDPYSSLPEIKNNYYFVKERMLAKRNGDFIYGLLKGLEIYDNSPIVDFALQNNLLIKDEKSDNYLKDEFGYLYRIKDPDMETVRCISIKMKNVLLDSINVDLAKEFNRVILDNAGFKQVTRNDVDVFFKESKKQLHFETLEFYEKLLLDVEKMKDNLPPTFEDDFINEFKEFILGKIGSFIENFKLRVNKTLENNIVAR
jgi:radical SAM superfamily enzyme YgiQ (UPF0313 family)